jgi:hypothetical protein
VNRRTAVILCLVLCLLGTSVPKSSAASRPAASTKTTLVSCLEQVSLMRDTYQAIFAKYPMLSAFGTVATDEVAMIATVKKVFAKYRIVVPSNSQGHAVRSMTSRATSPSTAYAVAIKLEQSTATLMTQLRQRTDSQDVLGLVALIKSASISSHVPAFAAEQATIGAPAPTPTSLANRPFPAPVTTRTVAVPASINATGTMDVSTALTSFVLSVPDGSIISFPSTAVYRIDRAIFLEDRHNLILDGNGCTLKYTSVTGTSSSYSFWYDWHNGARGSDIWIRNFVLIGSSPYPGIYTPGTSPTGGEGQHGVIVASNRFEVSGCTISAVWGDGFYVTGSPSDVWIHDNHVVSAGRHGLSVMSGSNVLAEHNTFDKVGYHTFDVEPNKAWESSANITFRSNTAGTYGEYFFNAVSSPGATIDEVVVDGNTVTGGRLSAYVDSVGTVRITRITFTNNAGMAVGERGPVLFFKHVDGLTVTGNIQRLSSGFLTRIIDCTGVTTS